MFREPQLRLKFYSAGINIGAIVADQGSNNRSCIVNHLKVTKENPYFIHNNKKIFVMYDPPHLFKSIRNVFLKKDVHTEDGCASWSCVKELHQLEKNRTTRMCPKLSSKHTFPNSWQKMKVSYAVQVLSHTCSAAIKTVNELGLFSKDTSEKSIATANLFEFLNDLFDCLNGKNSYDRNYLKRGIKRDGKIQEFLENAVNALLRIINMNAVNLKDTFCFQGLV